MDEEPADETQQEPVEAAADDAVTPEEPVENSEVVEEAVEVAEANEAVPEGTVPEETEPEETVPEETEPEETVPEETVPEETVPETPADGVIDVITEEPSELEIAEIDEVGPELELGTLVPSRSYEDELEGDEDEIEPEESIIDWELYPYGPEYQEITHSRLKDIAYELGLVRLCWPEAEIDSSKRKYYPETYTNNTTKEKLLLFLSENFRRQFHFNHVKRKPLMLAVENECGLQKMVCTTIRPTSLHYPEMNTFQSCAQFVADHIVYEPLSQITLLPSLFRSPAYTMERQKGHCFEMATLLCSYLIPTCYDAYVVSGYASIELCKNDRTRFDCPYLEQDEEEEKVVEETEEPKYQVRPPRDLRSKFLLEMADREVRKAAAAEKQRLEEEAAAKEEFEKPKEDVYRGLRVHSWVLVLPPGRGVEKPFFIEPASGVCYDTSYDHYFGIESVWNDVNYWVNIQNTPEGCAQINYDLNDCKLWEHLLPGEPWLYRKVVERTEDENEITLQEKHLDIPASWVNRLEIANSVFEQRFPQGSKVQYFHKSKVEQFAPYVQRDGLVKRVTTYLDVEWKRPNMIYEYYSNREDNLYKNELNVLTQINIEYFTRGREESLKMHMHKRGDSTLEGERKLEFYDPARYDGLHILEMNPLYMTTHFKERTDYLFYRHAVFATKSGNASEIEVRRSVVKLTERFNRNPEKLPGKDVAQRVFAIADNEILLKYHYEDGRITAETREFIKPPPTEMGDRLVFNPNLTCGYQPEQSAPPPKSMDLFVLFEQLLLDEETSLYYVRDYEDEVGLILRNRINELGMKKLAVSIFDKERNESALKEMQELEESERIRKMRETQRRVDYLAPYMARRGNPDTVPKQMAKEIREECLNDYKQLLVDRANRIQAAFEREASALLDKYAWYEKNQDIISREEEEEYFEYTNNTKFLLNTLEIQMNRHKELAPLRYKTVETSLMLDRRMLVLNC